MEKMFEANPPPLYGKQMNIEKHGTWLGEEIGGSLSDCITLTLNKRIPLIRKSIMEIKHVIEDCRSMIIGGIQTGMLLWNSCLDPLLFNNSSTWIQISNNDINRLFKIQNLFLNMLLGVYKCPAPMMYWDLKVLVPPIKILKEKLLFHHHVSTLPPNSLSYMILQVQRKFNFPSIEEEQSRRCL